MVYILILVLALISSMVTNIVFFIRYKNVGTLKIDISDPSKDVYRFEVDDIDALMNRKRIVLNVDSNADLSQN